MNKNSKPRTVDIVHPSYQPNAKELAEDLRLEGTFEEAIKALVRPVRARYVKSPERKRRAGVFRHLRI